LQSVEVNGKKYTFKRFVLGELKKIIKFEAKHELGSLNLFEMMGDDGKFDAFKPVWLEYCSLLFENSDSGLSIENMTMEDVNAIREGFINAAIGTPKKPIAA